MTVASEFLERLLQRGESAQLKSKSGLRLPLSKGQCPGYHAMRDLQEAEAFRGELAAAVHSGAITIERLPGHAWPRDVGAVTIENLATLGTFLSIPLRQDRVAKATQLLAVHADQHPVLNRVLELWANGRNVRRAGPEAAEALLQAIGVVDARHGAIEDALIRRESIRLLGGSKIIETLVPWIDVVSSGEIMPSGLSPDEVLAGLGLFREPQPFLIAGTGLVALTESTISLARPYLGLPVEAIRSFDIAGEPDFLLSVENKQTFHETARLADARRGIVVYTGGMPSPAWLRAFALLATSTPASTPCYHFGDLDLGGFRIAGVIGRAISEHGRQLCPWLMEPSSYRPQSGALQEVTASVAASMQQNARKLGWEDIAIALAESPGVAEQEAIPPQLPIRAF